MSESILEQQGGLSLLLSPSAKPNAQYSNSVGTGQNLFPIGQVS